MKDTFNLILNSQNSTNRTGSLNSYTYFINWSSVLPEMNKTLPQTFNVTWTLKTINTSTNQTQSALVDVNFGQTNTCTQENQPSTIIGYIYPVPVQQSSTTWNYYLTATPYDNLVTTISYPVNNFITVKFSDFNSGTAFTMLNYVLILNFEAV